MIDLFTLFKSMKYDANVLCNVVVFSLVFVVWDFEFCMLKLVKICQFSISEKF